jgi:PAS domain S-box-containing protein
MKSDDVTTSYWRHVADLSPSMMAYWDRDLRCRFTNRAYDVWLGASGENIVGRTMRELMGPMRFELNEPSLRRVLNGDAQTFERVMPGPGGVSHTSLAQYTPHLVDGVVQGVVELVTDVTKLKEEQQRLTAAVAKLEEQARLRLTAQESHHALAAALESAGAGFLAAGPDGRVTTLNAVAERICGWTVAEARGQPLWNVFHREGVPQEVEGLSAVDVMVRDGVTVEQKWSGVALSREGRRTAVEATAGLTRDPLGKVRGMSMIMVDLSERLAARMSEASADERFRRVVEEAPSGMLMVDARRTIVMLNRKTEELFGYSRRELIGQRLEVLVPLGARARHEGHVERFQAEPNVRSMGGRRELFGRAKDGRELPIEVGLTPINMADGTYTLASIVDITSRKAIEDELKRSNAELEQFAYVASHDLQEPLRMVASYTELLAQKYQGKLDEKADKYIFYAVDGARRMQQLVKDLLAYSRIGSQGHTLKPMTAEGALSRVRAMLQPSLTAAGATLEVGSMPTVLADDTQLEQLFQNLIGNAVKFRRPEVPLRITIEARRELDHWVFTVGDNGIGFEPRYSERIFQMFQRLHERGRYEGSGIGLSIVKRIVERHGGQISATSTFGEGATFVFSLRAADLSADS